MSNIEVSLPTVDGGVLFPHEFGKSCKLAIHTLYSDDFAAPPKYMQIEIKTDSGKTVKIVIPYDHTSKATVTINSEKV